MKKFVLILLVIQISTVSFTQNVQDSLQVAINNLNRQMMEDIQKYETSNSDFLILRVNDSLSYHNNSYIVHFNADSCTSSYCISFNGTFSDEFHLKYDLHYIHISFANDGFGNKCPDRLSQVLEEINNGYIVGYQHQELNMSELQNKEYLLYGRIGNIYVKEEFDHSFIAEFHSGMLYDLVRSLFGNIVQ